MGIVFFSRLSRASRFPWGHDLRLVVSVGGQTTVQTPTDARPCWLRLDPGTHLLSVDVFADDVLADLTAPLVHRELSVEVRSGQWSRVLVVPETGCWLSHRSPRFDLAVEASRLE